MKKIDILIIVLVFSITPLVVYKYPLWGALYLSAVPMWKILRLYLSAKFINASNGVISQVDKVTKTFILIQLGELAIAIPGAYFIGMFLNYLLQKFNIVIPYLTV